MSPITSRRLRSRIVTLRPGHHVGVHATQDREEVIVALRGSVTVEFPASGRAPGRAARRTLRAGSALFIGDGVLHDVVNRSRASATYLYAVALADDAIRMRPEKAHPAHAARRGPQAGHVH